MQGARRWRNGFSRIAKAAGLLTLVAAAAGCASKKSSTGPGPTPPPNSSVGLLLVKSGLGVPTFLTGAPGDTSRLFVVEKGGVIRIIKSGNLLPAPFLDISGLVSTGDEQGLLGMAFDPNYAINGRYYVSYTPASGDSSRIARYLVSANPDVSGPLDRIMLTFAQPPEVNHKGGMLEFSPKDHYLYASFGDGGGQGDPRGTGQTKNDFLGSLLRLDVSGPGDYGIPADNPFPPPALGELWDYGLRNPWRFSFDRVTGDLYIADVGQDQHEEINVAAYISGGGKGANYGWSITEGNDCFNPNTGCNTTGITFPTLVYDHVNGDCAVIGGFVYRGSAMPSLRGTYFYGDHCNHWVKSFRFSGGAATQRTSWSSLTTLDNITSFGEDTRGELYVLTLAGDVFKIVPQ